MRTPTPSDSRAFTLFELLAVVVIVSVLVSLLAVGQSTRRESAATTASIGNLKAFGTATGSYAADFAERLWSFSWEAGAPLPSTFPDLQGPFGIDQDAAIAQATDIIRRRGPAGAAAFQRPMFWLPHVTYSHLVLADYWGSPVPLPEGIAPDDDFIRARADDPAQVTNRNAYASSYELAIAAWSVNSGPNAITQSGAHSTFVLPATNQALVPRFLTEVTRPAGKAQMWERYQYQVGTRAAFFMYPEARVPVLMFDGSVAVRLTSTANPGWSPQSPNSPSGLTVVYQPGATEPPALPGVGTSLLARYRFTRQGLAGRDFDGPEVTQ